MLEALRRIRMTGAGAFDADKIIEAMAPLLGLAVTDADRPSVRAHLETAARLNANLDAVAIADAIEPAPVFTPEPHEAAR
jgi:Flp pilus assembly CpaF family ATPase